MILAIRHYPDRKRPCIVLEEGNQALVLGYLTDAKREKWLRKAMAVKNVTGLSLRIASLYTLDEVMKDDHLSQEDINTMIDAVDKAEIMRRLRDKE